MIIITIMMMMMMMMMPGFQIECIILIFLNDYISDINFYKLHANLIFFAFCAEGELGIGGRGGRCSERTWYIEVILRNFGSGEECSTEIILAEIRPIWNTNIKIKPDVTNG